jgi:hypothetical protein
MGEVHFASCMFFDASFSSLAVNKVSNSNSSVARFDHRPAIIQFREHPMGSAVWFLVSVFSYTTLQKKLYEKYKVVKMS